MSELFAYAGVFAMTRENLGFVRQLTEMAQTVDDADMLPPGKSVLPIELWKRVSPVKVRALPRNRR